MKPADLPGPGDAAGTRALWAAVKQGEFRNVAAPDGGSDESDGDSGEDGGAVVCPVSGQSGGAAAAGSCPAGASQP